ncbi:MAG: type II toxin-antitoxin system PemK/MazF family toxin [Verrucomicrobia bacterium]|nr:type II toxin-antitoxin system PemK/MazF family toxin [Verrucomicrobiota bacterium]
MTTRPGEIYLVDLGVVAKVRPAVVVSRHDPDTPRALAIFVPLTTEYRRPHPDGVLRRDALEAGEHQAVPPEFSRQKGQVRQGNREKQHEVRRPAQGSPRTLPMPICARHAIRGEKV